MNSGIGTSHIWMYALDVALMGALFLFVFKFLRAPGGLRQAKRLTDLESTLRALISEATAAGNTLNEELLNRKRELVSILGNIDEAQKKNEIERNRLEGVQAECLDIEKRLVPVQSRLEKLIVKSKHSVKYLNEELEKKSSFVAATEPPRPVFASAVAGLKKTPKEQVTAERISRKSLDLQIEKETTKDIEKELHAVAQSADAVSGSLQHLAEAHIDVRKD